jgi:hypothetical protein
METPNNKTPAAAPSTGFHCSTCFAQAGQQHAAGCSEAGLASAVGKAIEILAALDLAKVPLAVPAALGVLRCGLDVVVYTKAKAPSQIKTWHERFMAWEYAKEEDAMKAEIAELRAALGAAHSSTGTPTEGADHA